MRKIVRLDREALVDVTGRGEEPAYGIIPEGVSGYEAARYAWSDLSYEERLEQAAELYRKSGYSKDKPLRLTLLYDAGDIHETIALAVSAMWYEALGVEVQLVKREWNTFLTAVQI